MLKSAATLGRGSPREDGALPPIRAWEGLVSLDRDNPFVPSDALATPIKCKHCVGAAHLIRLQPAGSGREQRTFECARCQQQTMITVQT